ncbi:MAG TPA: aminotransferase class V-fold PLP-dependent enzyme, partial [Balneolaceae bacterium]|nr:aminotransferase class V-fold PLP-dependent enzyme [Balneolaceae bacterium]
MHIETKAIHAGLHAQKETSDVVPPIHKSTIFEHSKEGHQKGDLTYTRDANPNRLQLEHLLAELEEGESCAAFSSGVAAATAVLQARKPGDHVLMPDDVYTGNRQLINNVMKPWGLEADFISMTDIFDIKKAIQKNTVLIWVETPSNPLLNITDIKAVCDLAHQNDAIVCVDNTWPSPVNQMPL